MKNGLGKELAELDQQTDQLTEAARTCLRADDESAARLALLRKQEVADVVGGLKQQLKAAHATREHLTTTLRALEARLSEARRRQLELQASPKARVASKAGSDRHRGRPPRPRDRNRAGCPQTRARAMSCGSLVAGHGPASFACPFLSAMNGASMRAGNQELAVTCSRPIH